jgi:hypothetical protein
MWKYFLTNLHAFVSHLSYNPIFHKILANLNETLSSVASCGLGAYQKFVQYVTIQTKYNNGIGYTEELYKQHTNCAKQVIQSAVRKCKVVLNFSALMEPRKLIRFSLHRCLFDHTMNQLNARYLVTHNSLTYNFNILPSVPRNFPQKWLSRASHYKAIETKYPHSSLWLICESSKYDGDDRCGDACLHIVIRNGLQLPIAAGNFSLSLHLNSLPLLFLAFSLYFFQSFLLFSLSIMFYLSISCFKKCTLIVQRGAWGSG